MGSVIIYGRDPSKNSTVSQEEWELKRVARYEDVVTKLTKIIQETHQRFRQNMNLGKDLHNVMFIKPYFSFFFFVLFWRCLR